MPLSTHEYKWVPEISQENLMKCSGGSGGEFNNGMDRNPIQGVDCYSQSLYERKPRL